MSRQYVDLDSIYDAIYQIKTDPLYWDVAVEWLHEYGIDYIVNDHRVIAIEPNTGLWLIDSEGFISTPRFS